MYESILKSQFEQFFRFLKLVDNIYNEALKAPITTFSDSLSDMQTIILNDLLKIIHSKMSV